MTSVLLDKTALLVRLLLPVREEKAYYCTWFIEEQLGTWPVKVLVRGRDVEELGRSLSKVCEAAEREFALYEKRDGKRSADRSVMGFSKHVANRREAVDEQERVVLTRLLACISLLLCTWIRNNVNRKQQFADLEEGFQSLRQRLEWRHDLDEIVESSPCRGRKGVECSTSKFLEAFMKGWGSSLLSQANEFMERTEQELKWIAEMGAVRGGYPRPQIIGSVESCIDAFARVCDTAASSNPNDPVLQALAAWAWEKWEAAQGPVLLLRLCEELQTSSPSCICESYDDVVTLALGTVRAWNKRGKKASRAFEGADTLLSLNWQLRYCSFLGISSQSVPGGVQSRREHRVHLSGSVELKRGQNSQAMTLIDVSLSDNLSVTGQRGHNWRPYQRILPIQLLPDDPVENYIPLSSSSSRRWRLRRVLDTKEDPIQAFFAAG